MCGAVLLLPQCALISLVSDIFIFTPFYEVIRFLHQNYKIHSVLVTDEQLLVQLVVCHLFKTSPASYRTR